MVTTDEPEQWARACAGDGRAFAALFDQHRNRLYRHVLRLVPSAHDAEDVVAASFFELWRRRDRVPVIDGSVLPWLLLTATNVARNTRRGLRRHRAAIDRLPRDTALDDPIATVEDRAARKRLLSAIRGLSDTDAAVLVLVADGATSTEVADLLGITAGAARVRLHRARRRLQQHLVLAAADPQGDRA